tara:strand:+ start:2899 stop:3237 length:339 start_codon:yes stop_codon:yes gene_type:complete
MKGFIWLYLIGFLSVAGLATLVVNLGYQTGNLKQELSSINKDLQDAKAREIKFKTDVYTAMATLINGQRVLSLGQLRIHHFVEPHADKFYPGCQECEKEREEILDKDSITTK